NEGDGHYAYTCVIPQEYRDGAERKADVRVLTPGYEESRLKTRADAVVIRPDLLVPEITVKAVTGEWIEGSLSPIPNRRLVGVDVWIDGRRLPETDLAI